MKKQNALSCELKIFCPTLSFEYFFSTFLKNVVELCHSFFMASEIWVTKRPSFLENYKELYDFFWYFYFISNLKLLILLELSDCMIWGMGSTFFFCLIVYEIVPTSFFHWFDMPPWLHIKFNFYCSLFLGFLFWFHCAVCLRTSPLF